MIIVKCLECDHEESVTEEKYEYRDGWLDCWNCWEGSMVLVDVWRYYNKYGKLPNRK